jgi:triosephosphate isomerase
MRKPFVAGNWKMHKTAVEAIELVNLLKNDIESIEHVESVFCVPFTSVNAVYDQLKNCSIGVGVQNVHWEDKGAFTGEISPVMVKEFAKYVIIGHSERRTYFGETDETVNKRLKAALSHGLIAIVCVGETLSENKAGQTLEVITRQMRLGFEGIDAKLLSNVVVAYEPVWAIGTGLACDALQANEVILKTIRQPISEMYWKQLSEEVRVLYGGSVKGSNAREYFSQSEIDGALVGGAALTADFIEIVRAAAH